MPHNESNNNSIFVDGYVFEVKNIDFDSDEIKKTIAETIDEQQKIIQRKYIDLESLNKIYTV